MESQPIRRTQHVRGWTLTILLRNGRELPDWIAEFLSVAGRQVVAIAHRISDDSLEEVGAREATRSSTEAEKVGKAMGFGSRGPGRGSCFEDARTLRRDRIIRSAIEEKLAAGIKKDFAYDEIASEVGVSRSTVQRAYVNGAGS
jgi:DNA invertase Pin-like site-specific DNA recombinase